MANITNNAKALFEQDILEQHYTKFIVLSYRAISLYSPPAQDNYHKDLHAYLADVHRICSDIWVKFDPGQMMQGLLFVAFETIFIFLLIGNLKVYQLQKVFSRKILFFAYISDLFVGTVVVQYTWQVFGFGSTEHAAIVMISMFNIGFLAILVMANWPQIAKNLSEIRFTNPFARMMLIASVSVFFSNSYIVQEQQVLCYMLMGVLLVFLFDIRKTCGRFDLRTKWKFSSIFNAPFTRLAILTAIVIVVLRNSQSFFRCREEQGNCTDFETVSNYYESERRPTTNNRTDTSIYHPTVALAVFIILTRLHLKSCGNLRGHSLHVFFTQSGGYLGGMAIGSYFILSQTSNHGVSQWNIDALAWIIYGLSAIQIVLLFISPLLVDIDDNSLLPSANGITQIFHKIRNELNATGFGPNVRDDYVYKIPLIHGLTTIHSAVLISFGSGLALVIALLLGPDSAGGLFLSLCVAAGIAVLSAVLRYQTESRLGESAKSKEFFFIQKKILFKFFLFNFFFRQMPQTSGFDNGGMVSTRPVQFLCNVTSTNSITNRLACSIRRSSSFNTTQPYEQHFSLDGAVKHIRWSNTNIPTVSIDHCYRSNVICQISITSTNTEIRYKIENPSRNPKQQIIVECGGRTTT